MSEWKEYSFLDAVEVNPGARLLKGADYPFVDMAAIQPSAPTVAESEIRTFGGAGSRFQPFDTLMARITPCLENGKIARFVPSATNHREAFGSTEFIVIRGKEGVTDNDFAYYLTKWDEFHRFAISKMSGSSGRQRVPVDALAMFRFLLPPPSVQKRIAEILGSLDEKIELNRRTSATLEQMAQALFRSWFVDFDPVKAKAAGKRPKNLAPEIFRLFPKEFEDSPLGPVPKGWTVSPLSDHITASKGLSYKGAHLCGPGEGVPMHNLNSVLEGGGYKYEGLKWYNGEHKPIHLISPGDVIVTNTEQGFEHLLIGYAAIVPKRYGERGLFSHHIFCIKSKTKSYLHPWFFYLLLRTNRFHQIVAGFSNGTTVNMLPLDGLQKPVHVVPPKEIVNHFGNMFLPLQEKLEQIHDENISLISLRDSLLPKLMSGEVEV